MAYPVQLMIVLHLYVKTIPMMARVTTRMYVTEQKLVMRYLVARPVFSWCVTMEMPVPLILVMRYLVVRPHQLSVMTVLVVQMIVVTLFWVVKLP